MNGLGQALVIDSHRKKLLAYAVALRGLCRAPQSFGLFPVSCYCLAIHSVPTDPLRTAFRCYNGVPSRAMSTIPKSGWSAPRKRAFTLNKIDEESHNLCFGIAESYDKMAERADGSGYPSSDRGRRQRSGKRFA